MILLLLGTFIFFNVVYVLPHIVESPVIVVIAMRITLGIIVAYWYHIGKGMTLYDELKKSEAEHDSATLHGMRIVMLWAFILFAIYLTWSLVMLCRISGMDGSELRRRGNNRRFKRVPFGELYFKEGLDCAICMDRFTEKHMVVQLACHPAHVFHRTCIT